MKVKPVSKKLQYYSNYFLFTLLIFALSCGNSKRLSNQNLSLLYNTDQTFLQPQYSLFHFSKDSSRFYFQIAESNLLFKRNTENIFEANVVLKFELLPSYQDITVLDSGTVELSFKKDSLAMEYNGFVNFKMHLYTQAVLKITFHDLNRNQTHVAVLRVVKKTLQSSQFYLLKNDRGEILFHNILSPDERFSFQNNLTDANNLKVRYYHRNFPLAAPPFHIGDLPVFDYRADSVFDLHVNSNSSITFSNPGIYHLLTDTITKAGLTILIFKDDFPTPASAEQLIESLRYLTTRQEHDDLLQSADPKKAVDEYWMQRAGNPDRARKLIREYYTRVQEANRLFTSYLEGWKTDRGMIYIVFGPPQTIYRNDKEEQWNYGGANNLPDLSFVFEHVNNPFSYEDFNLIRTPNNETTWYMAVDEWRNGRVVNEY